MSTTKLRTSSSADNVIRTVLKNYLEGEISLSELQDLLRNYITINFHPDLGQREIYDLKIKEDIEFQVTEEHLRTMLQKLISQKISAIELSNWAAFIYMAPFFTPEGNTDDERWEAGERPLWDIIQQLAAPNNIYELTEEMAEKYINLLR